mgnify:CR=1 FL=1
MDISVLMRSSERLSAGFYISPKVKIKWKDYEESDFIPFRSGVGVAYTFPTARYSSPVMIEADLFNKGLKRNVIGYSLGIEWQPFAPFGEPRGVWRYREEPRFSPSLRFGIYQMIEKEDTGTGLNFSFGIGTKVPYGRLDLAFFTQQLGNSVAGTFVIGF